MPGAPDPALVLLQQRLVAGVFALAVVTFIALTFVTAPYGRHARTGWGARHRRSI